MILCRENVVSMKDKIDDILQNNAGINRNGNENTNNNFDIYQEDRFDMKGLPEALRNESDDFYNYFKKFFFPEI